MVVDLRPQQSRATVMIVAGIGLVAFGIWGLTRPELFPRRLLPVIATVSGALFILVAMALRRVPRGFDAIALEDGQLVLSERGERAVIGLGVLSRIHLVEEPLGRGHPLLCLGTRGGGLIELSLMRYGHIEPMAAAMREDIALGADALPPSTLDTVTVVAGQLRWGERHWPLNGIHAVDYVHHLSVHGAGLVIHEQPIEALSDDGMIDAARVMRRIATGNTFLLDAVGATESVLLAIHIDRARTMMSE